MFVFTRFIAIFGVLLRTNSHLLFEPGVLPADCNRVEVAANASSYAFGPGDFQGLLLSQWQRERRSDA